MEPLRFSDDMELVLSTSRDLSLLAVSSLAVHGRQALNPVVMFPPNLIELRRIVFISKGVLCWAVAYLEGKTATYSVPVSSLAPHHSALVVRGSRGTIRELIPPRNGAESKNQAFSFSQSICIAGRSTASFSLFSHRLWQWGSVSSLLDSHCHSPGSPVILSNLLKFCCSTDKTINVMWWN